MHVRGVCSETHTYLGRDGDAITLSVPILLRRLGYLQEAAAPKEKEIIRTVSKGRREKMEEF